LSEELAEPAHAVGIWYATWRKIGATGIFTTRWKAKRALEATPSLLLLQPLYSRRLRVGRSSSLGWRSSGLVESAWLSLSFLLFEPEVELVSLSSALGSGRWVRRFRLGLFASSGEGLRFSSWASCVLTLLNSEVVTTYWSLSGRICSMFFFDIS